VARILVVSRNPAMAMGLSATDYEVVDLRPPSFADWITGDDDADALILDLDNPKLAVAAVTNLRAHAKLAPVLLVSSDRPGWDDPEMRQLPATEVLPLPISRPALLSALQDLIIGPWAHETVPSQHVEVTQALQELVLDPADLLSEDDDLDALLAAAPSVHVASPAAFLPPAEGAPPPESAFVLEADSPVHDAGVDEPVENAGSTPKPETAPESEPDPTRDDAATAAEHGASGESRVIDGQDDVPKAEAVGIVEPAEPVQEPASVLSGSSAPPVHSDASGTSDGRHETPSLSAIPRTRRSARIPYAETSTSLRDMEALRPAATVDPSVQPPRRRDHRRAAPTPEPAPSPFAADPDVASTAPTTTRTGRIERRSLVGVDLVRRLTLVVQTLYGVPETAEVVVVDAVDRTHADAGALLLPDEGAWRVAAGVGLRPLEHRYELHGDAWLVQQVAQAHKGVIIEESDIAREQLQGAPLASWRHLLAAPIPEIEALLLLARREDPPFDEEELSVLATLGAEAGALLAAAVDTRTLARAMWEFRDEPDVPR
jgi:hypothetical protein